jgi:hypothetical protein
MPDFETLKQLRDRLGLYGYTAVMSNFTCGGKAGDFKWPIEIAILSRFPIDEAVEHDPSPESLANCAHRGPYIEGPAHDASEPIAIPQEVNLTWPAVTTPRGTIPRPGPGFLTAEIRSHKIVIVAVKVPTADGYGSAGEADLQQMRLALTAAAGGWIWSKRDALPGFNFLLMGDLVREPVNRVSATPGGPSHDEAPGTDGVGALLTEGRIGSTLGSEGEWSGLRMLDLTNKIVSTAGETGLAPHSDRIYLWGRNFTGFGPAERALESYGSRSYPISVESSGVDCGIDPFLEWKRRGGIAGQFYTWSQIVLQNQIEAMHAAGNHGRWVVVMNIEGVIADNSPLFARFAESCKFPTQKDMDEWIAKGAAPLMPGVLSFIERVKEMAGSTGKIVILTQRRPDQAQATEDYLSTRLPGANGLLEIHYGMTPQNKDALFAEIARGARIVMVISNHLDRFPTDPDLPIGGTDKSCPLPPAGTGSLVFGPQTARFGICYGLLPEAVQ